MPRYIDEKKTKANTNKQPYILSIARFRVRDADGLLVEYSKGETVELTDSEYAAWKDKFEKPARKVAASTPTTVQKAPASATAPQSA